MCKGRGDSPWSHLGLAPAPVQAFARYVERVQAYLSGAGVAFDEPGGDDAPPPVASMGLAGAPAVSRLEWLVPPPESERGGLGKRGGFWGGRLFLKKKTFKS